MGETTSETEGQLLHLAGDLRARHTAIEQALDEVERHHSERSASPTTNEGRDSHRGAALRARLAALRERLDAIASAIDDRLDVVTHRVSAAREDVVGVIHSTEQAHSVLAQHAESSEASLTEDWAHFLVEIDRIASSLAGSTEHLEEHREALHQSLEGFEGGAGELVAEIARDVDSIADRVEGLLGEVLRRLHDLRERADAHIHGTLVDSALGDMERSVGELLEALRGLHLGTEDGARSLQQSIAGVGSTIRQIMQVVDTIRPILDAVRALS